MGDPGPAEPEDPRCPVQIGRGWLTLRRDGTVRVKLSCERGCGGSVEIVRDLAREPVVGRFRSFALKPGETKSVAVRIDAATRKILRRRKTLAVRVLVRSRDRASEQVEFRRRVTLRR